MNVGARAPTLTVTAHRALSQEARAFSGHRGGQNWKEPFSVPGAWLAMQMRSAALASSCWRLAPLLPWSGVLGAFPSLRKGLAALPSAMNSSFEGGSWEPPSAACAWNSQKQAFGHELATVPYL